MEEVDEEEQEGGVSLALLSYSSLCQALQNPNGPSQSQTNITR